MDWLLLLLRAVLDLLRPNGTEQRPVAVRPDGTTVPLPPGSLPPGSLPPGSLLARALSAETLAETLPAGPARCIDRSLGDWLTLFLPFDRRVSRDTVSLSRRPFVGPRYLPAQLAASGPRCLKLHLPPRLLARDGHDAANPDAANPDAANPDAWQRLWLRMTGRITLRSAPVTQESMSQESMSLDSVTLGDGRDGKTAV